jgi:hypothetical protein
LERICQPKCKIPSAALDRKATITALDDSTVSIYYLCLLKKRLHRTNVESFQPICALHSDFSYLGNTEYFAFSDHLLQTEKEDQVIS